MAKKTNVTIYHNPKCGTSSNVLAYLRETGIEPTVIEYLKTPPSKAELKSLAARSGGVAGILRWKDRKSTRLNSSHT